MSRFLLAWELGGHLGHLSVQLPIACLLRDRGHEVLFAVKDVGTAVRLLDAEGFAYVQTPVSLARKARLREPASFADILGEAGFAEPDVLHGLIRAWHNLFRLVQPSALLCQYAPSAQLAARLARLSSLEVCMGFERPPKVAPFPCFRPWLGLTKDLLLKKEGSILDNINNACARYGFPSFRSLQAALESDVTLLATLPELDHYRGRKGARYIGPLFVADDGLTATWSGGGTARIFVYVKGGAEIPTVLETLERSGASVIAFIPDINEKLRGRFSSDRLKIYTSKVRLTPLLPEMDLAVTNGNHGTVSVALLAGVPLLSIPTTIEQWLLCANIERLGAGVGIRRDRATAEFSSCLEKVLANGGYRERAKRLAEKYAAYDPNRVAERIANTLERLSERGNNPPSRRGMATNENDSEQNHK